MTIRGVDVSSVQQTVDYEWLASQGFSFVIAKSYTGNDGADPTFQTNITNARAQGLSVAAYNFLYPLQTDPNHPNRDPQGQAQLHYKHTGDILTAADLEFPEVQAFSKWNVSASFIHDWTLSYLQEYTRISGRLPMLYTYPYYAQTIQFCSDYAKYPLWIASYEPQPTIPKPWQSYAVWQDAGGDNLMLPSGIKCDTDQCPDISIFEV